MQRKENKKKALVFLFLIALDAVVWWNVVFFRPHAEPQISFLDVGQGDATLLILEGGAKVLVDAGARKDILYALRRELGSSERYIDLAVITHPELDHFGGFVEVLEEYEIGAFLMSGRFPEDKNSDTWSALMEKIKEKEIPIVTVGEGDALRQGRDGFGVLSPNPLLLGGAEPNDASIVLSAHVSSLDMLLTGDISASVERYLAGKYDLSADILKVSHHGSKYSSDGIFLEEVAPSVALIGVGENRYGHPTEEALGRVHEAGARMFRTDLHGNIKILPGAEVIHVFTEKEPSEGGR